MAIREALPRAWAADAAVNRSAAGPAFWPVAPVRRALLQHSPRVAEAAGQALPWLEARFTSAVQHYNLTQVSYGSGFTSNVLQPAAGGMGGDDAHHVAWQYTAAHLKESPLKCADPDLGRWSTGCACCTATSWIPGTVQQASCGQHWSQWPRLAPHSDNVRSNMLFKQTRCAVAAAQQVRARP